MEDFRNNKADKFTAVIYGLINDFVVNIKTREIEDNPERTTYKFSDSYHFIRKEDKWLLNEIGVDKDVFDFTFGKIYVE